AAVMEDHALGVARGSRRVVERDRLPLVADRDGREVGRALREERLVLDGAEPLSRPVVEWVVEIDDPGLRVEAGPGRAAGRREFAVGDEDLGLAVSQVVGDR